METEKQIVVTGAAGYIGQMLIERLAGGPGIKRIMAVDVKRPSPLPAGVEFRECDVRSPDLGKNLRGCDTVVHLAFIVADIHDRKLTYDINVNGSRNVFAACEEIGIEKLVAASSIAAYGRQPRENQVIVEETPRIGDSASYYLHTKRILEEDLDTFEQRNPGVIVTRLRPSILFGPKNHNFARELGRFPVLPRVPGGTFVPVVHEEDVVEAFVLAVERDAPGPFIISLPEPITLEEVALKTGKPMFAIQLPTLLRLLALAHRLHLTDFSPDWMVSAETCWRFDISRAREILGWSPKHDLETTFDQMWENIRQNRWWNRRFKRLRGGS